MSKISLILLIIISIQFSTQIFAQNVKILLDNCSLEEEVLKEIEDALNFQLHFYTRIFNDSVKSDFKARIFGRKSDFIKYSKQIADFNPTKEGAIAFYSPMLNEMIIPIELTSFTNTFKHELNHAIYNSFCEDIPDWINEGLSELFEIVVFKDGQYEFQDILVNRISRFKQQLLEGEKIHKTFEYDAFYGPNDSNHYGVAFIVVWFLYVTQPDLLDEMITQACGFNDYLVDLIYPGGLESLNTDIRSFLFNQKSVQKGG